MFWESNKTLPSPSSKSIQEHKLYNRFQSIITNSSSIQFLKKYDKHNILPDITSQVDQEITNEFSQHQRDQTYHESHIKTESNNIFNIINLTNVLKKTKKPDFTATRKPCKNFDEYELLFKDCHQKLKSGEYIFTGFKEVEHLFKGGAKFFVTNGVLALVVKLDITETKFSKKDGRSRIIFENGTESNMKIRSFGKALFSNGKSIIPNLQETIVQNQPKSTGLIYILSSLSQDPEISSIQNLYKIGYCTTSIEKRIKNAESDPTYLNAKVKIISTGQINNIDPQRLENLIHRFFGECCLNIKINNGKGGQITPREWFIVPLDCIYEGIELVTSGNIINYKYDYDTKKIVLK